jgi:hypothetical protein
MVKFAWPNSIAHLSFGLASMRGGMSDDGTMYAAFGPRMEAKDVFEERVGVE